jgi:FdhD protein
MGRRSARVFTRRLRPGGLHRSPDELAVEEPLAIELDGVLVATTMRSPGHDFELAAGFCHTEGLLGGAPVRRCRYCAPDAGPPAAFNLVAVETGGLAPPATPRLGPTSSACGLCGSATLTDLQLRLPPLPATAPIPLEVLAAVPDRVRPHQHLFDRTGAVHAAAAFDPSGAVGLVREDIGRHNAVDKVVGRLLLDGALPATGLGLFVSGRASYELVQKAWAGGFAALVAVSAPTALAVEAARAAGLVLVGFARGGSLNVYCDGGEDRRSPDGGGGADPADDEATDERTGPRPRPAGRVGGTPPS